MMERLKKGGFMRQMRLVDDPLQKKQKKNEKATKEVKFDSGSERDSYRLNDDSLENIRDDISGKNSNNSNISVNMAYKPTVITKQADLINKKYKEDELL